MCWSGSFMRIADLARRVSTPCSGWLSSAALDAKQTGPQHVGEGIVAQACSADKRGSGLCRPGKAAGARVARAGLSALRDYGMLQRHATFLSTERTSWTGAAR